MTPDAEQSTADGERSAPDGEATGPDDDRSTPDDAAAGVAARDTPVGWAGTTALFAVLVSTVAATAFLVYMLLWLTPSSHAVRMADAQRDCYTNMATDIAATADGLARATAEMRAAAECIKPVYREQAAWGLYGTVALFAVTLVLYWTAPARRRRRHRLTEIDPVDGAAMLAYLRELCDEVGLRRVPTFEIAPYALGSGGLAFGRWGRRGVQLDAGLVLAFVTDRPRFRAVVLHELAHLRNRDVDVTYLTRAVWQAFTALVLAPAIVVVFHPTVLSRPLSWRPTPTWQEGRRGTIIGILVLVGLVLLTRSAILRIREIHADARAARYDGPGGALRRAVEQLGDQRGRLRWLSTHPSPPRRLRAIDRPGEALRPPLWGVFLAALATAMTTVNLTYAMALVLDTIPTLVMALASAVCLPGLAVPIVVTMRGRVPEDPGGRVPARLVLLVGVLSTAGFLLGERLAWFSTLTEGSALPGAASWASVLLAAGLFLIGSVLLAAWSATVTAATPSPSTRRRLVLTAAAGTLAFAPWFAVWRTSYYTNTLTWLGPMTGWISQDLTIPELPGWLATAIEAAEAFYVPLQSLTYNPVTVPALVLLVCVPLVIAPSVRAGRRFAVLAGLTGAALFTLLGAAAILLAKPRLPLAARHSDGFLVAVHHLLIGGAVVITTVVVVVVAAVVRRHRAVAVPLALLTSALPATAVLNLGLENLARCTDLYGRAPRHCMLAPSVLLTAESGHQIIIKAAILAIPATLLGLGLGRLRRPEPGRPAVAAVRPPWVTVSALGVSALTLAGLIWPSAYSFWYAEAEVSAAPTPQECLVGSWKETGQQSERTYAGIEHVVFLSSGLVHHFGADGRLRQDYGTGVTEKALINGHLLELTISGTVTSSYTATDTEISYRDFVAQGTVTTTLDGTVRGTEPVITTPGYTTVDRYECVGDQMILQTDTYAATLVRIP